MNAQTRGLGRGLSALIPQSDAGAGQLPSGDVSSGILLVAVSDIIPNPRQPRTSLAEESLGELAASIKEHGLIQPLIVTRAAPDSPAGYQLIAGERRWRAAQMAGLTAVPVLLKEATPQESLELALVENIQRADLNALEEAAAYHALISEFSLSQQDVSDRVGKSRVAIANAVRLLRLPESTKAMLADGALSEGHCRALLALPSDDLIVHAGEQVAARGLSVRQTEELVRRMLAASDEPATEEDAQADDPDSRHTSRLEDAFRVALGTKVSLSRGRRGGRLVIHFYSDEELQAIYDHIVGETQ